MNFRCGRFAELFQLTDDLHDLFDVFLISTQNQHTEVVNSFDVDFTLQASEYVTQGGGYVR